MKDQEYNLQEAKERFSSLLGQQDATLRRRVEDRAKRLDERISGLTGECGTWFDEVLPSGSFSLGYLPQLATTADVALETAAILCQLSLGKGLVEGQHDSGSQYLGWNNLNKDAKVWCKGLLLFAAPSTASKDDLLHLLNAKLFAAILVDYMLPCAPRAVGEAGLTTILDADGVDK